MNRSLTLDGITSQSQNTLTRSMNRSLTLDGITSQSQNTLTRSLTLDGKSVLLSQFATDGIINQTLLDTFTADGIVCWSAKKRQLEIDGYVSRQGYRQNWEIDGILNQLKSQTFTTDGYLQIEQSNTLSIDGLIKQIIPSAITIDGGIIPNTVRYTKTFTADSILNQTLSTDFETDSIVLETKKSYATIDGYLKWDKKTVAKVGIKTPLGWFYIANSDTYKLGDTDVTRATPNDGDTLVYNSETGEYETVKLSYTHNQHQTLNTWIVNHNLQTIPSVKVIDNNGSELYPDYIQHLNTNTLEIHFGIALTGTAYITR